MMHKEVVARKKAPVIAIVLLIITFMLYLQQALKFIKFKSLITLEICNMAILVFTCMILIREIISCTTAYKYSVIADKLIVNKIFGSKEKNLTSIKLSNIKYIGLKSEAPKLKSKFVGCFVCSFFNNSTCVCIYEDKGKLYRFSFEPSSDFVCRLNRKLV